ncbi:MAG: hypothetical protein WD473_07610 [Acidimicrobiia bacterium]
MPESTTDHISITFRGVEDLAAFRRRRHVEAVVPHLLDSLRRRGDVSQHSDEADEADLWREAARVAGRRLGVHVRTGRTRCVCPDRDGVHVWAVNLDVEVSEAELRAAVNRAAALMRFSDVDDVEAGRENIENAVAAWGRWRDAGAQR